MKKFFSCLIVFLALFIFIACKGSDVTITFESNGGSSVAAITAKAEDSITKPADPTKSSMTFGGWYKDIDLTEKYDFPSKMPEEGLTVYAKWVVTLTFDSQGGPSVSPIIGEGGKTYKMPADPVREGYVFVGWFLDKAYTQKLTYVMPKTNSTAYARWQVYETGSTINVPLNFSDNDSVYSIVKEADGVLITATGSKTEWGYLSTIINVPNKKNTTTVFEIMGTKDVNVTLKLEGGNSTSAAEITVAMTGEKQRIILNCIEDNLSTISGQKVLVFLNGGTTGCNAEKPEFVKIYSIKMYRTLEATDTQRAAIYFATFGGTEIEAYYDIKGTKVVAPADPERPGYIFQGWFSDPEFTTPFVFDTIPEKGAIAYAKWEAEKALLYDVDLMGYTPNILPEGAYDIKVTKDSYVIKKTEKGTAWDCFTIAIPEGAELGGYNYLRIEIVGKAGEKMLFKVNDIIEKTVVCTGEKQVLDLPFDLNFDMTKVALAIFANGGENGPSGEFTITKLAFGNHPEYVNLIGKEWSKGEESAHEITVSDKNIILKKNAIDGQNWDCVVLDITEDLTNFNKLTITFKGTKDERLLVKVFDKKEFMIVCTGEVQQEVLEFTESYEGANHALVLFANPDALGTGNEFVISELSMHLVMPELPTEDVNLIEGTIEYPENNTVSEEITLSKTEGGEWDWAGILVPEADVTGVVKMIVGVTGPNGETLKLKAFDSGAGEKDVVCTGEYQEVEFDISAAVYAEGKQHMIIFCNPGVKGTGNVFTITKLQFAKADGTVIDLMSGILTDGSLGSYKANKNIILSKENAQEWDCFQIKIPGDLSLYNTLKYTVIVPEGEELILKVNDQVETKVVGTGEAITGTFAYNLTYDETKATLVLFVNPGATGTGHKFVFSNLALAYDNGIVKPNPEPEPEPEPTGDIDLSKGTITYPADNTIEEQFILSKTVGGPWDWVGVSVEGADVTGVVKMIIGITGPNGETIKVKAYDSGDGEKDVICTGEYQEVEADISAAVYVEGKQHVIIFCNPDAVGTGNEFVISKLQFVKADGTIIDLMKGTLLDGSNGSYKAKKALVIAKNTGTDWDNFQIAYPGDLSKYNVLKYTVVVPTGEELILKVNDQVETKIIGTGEVVTGEFKYTITYNKDKATLLMFVNPGKPGTGNKFIISSLVLSKDDSAPEEIENADLLNGVLSKTDVTETAFVIQASKIVSSQWENLQVMGSSEDFTGYNKLDVTLIGPKGERVLIKVYDIQECWIDCTGELQTLSFDVTATHPEGKCHLYVFCNGGADGTGNPFIFMTLKLSGDDKSMDLLTGSWSQSTDKAFTLQKTLAVTKLNTSGEWDNIQLKVEGDLSKCNTLKYEVEGSIGAEIILKVNDQVETKVVCTGEALSGSFKYNITFDPSKASIVILPEPGKAGTGEIFNILNLVLCYEE